MPDKRLKSTILEAVDNQLSSEECLFVNEAYEELLMRGYNRQQAKEKIGAVLLTDMYDMLSDKKEYDEEKYRAQIAQMLEEDASKPTGEWEEDMYGDEGELWQGIGKAMNEGDTFFENNEPDKCLECWEPVWERLKSNVAQAFRKMELFEVDEATDYQYGFEDWTKDVINVYLQKRDFEKLIQFCEEVKETFAWEETAPNEFNETIGDALRYMGKTEECDAWYAQWYEKEPDNYMCIDAYVLHLACTKQVDKAEALLEETLGDAECNFDNHALFMRAASLFKTAENEEKAAYYKKKCDEFVENIMANPSDYGIGDDGEDTPFFFGSGDYEKQEPIVKPAKIYPNDPCPCGSGKKYKKCCGKG